LDGFFEVEPEQALADVYVWLRYSATRQLTWQRNYNTQPRTLSAAQACGWQGARKHEVAPAAGATLSGCRFLGTPSNQMLTASPSLATTSPRQERLTKTISEAHARTHGEAQEWVRLMLATVGRGGDGQRIRDEILHIMHRNRIPEVKGTWMEEWHQKLHNNTTPDDVPICSAYLAFLEVGGKHKAVAPQGPHGERVLVQPWCSSPHAPAWTVGDWHTRPGHLTNLLLPPGPSHCHAPQSGGDEGRYWRVLSDAGVTRQRLESFDRPIKAPPQYFADKRVGLPACLPF
jgi:hypothetical protein